MATGTRVLDFRLVMPFIIFIMSTQTFDKSRYISQRCQHRKFKRLFAIIAWALIREGFAKVSRLFTKVTSIRENFAYICSKKNPTKMS